MNILEDIETVIYAEGEADKYGHNGYCFDCLPRKVTYLNKQFHSFNDEPAVINLNKQEEQQLGFAENKYLDEQGYSSKKEFKFYFKNGVLHRDHGVTIEFYEYDYIAYMYIVEGKLHRPLKHWDYAVEDGSGHARGGYYFLNGDEYTNDNYYFKKSTINCLMKTDKIKELFTGVHHRLPKDFQLQYTKSD